LRDAASPAVIAPLGVAVIAAGDVPVADAALFATSSTALLAAVERVPGVYSFALVTCERAMLVQWGAPERVGTTLQQALGALGASVASSQIRCHVGVDAVRHLLSLAAGLESSRLGEHEILGQLRNAWGNAWAHERPHPTLDRTLQQVIGASRYVRAAFPSSSPILTLGDEAVGAVESAWRSTDWSTRRALVVGTGSAATSALAALRRVRPAALSVVGRTPARVREVALRYDALPFWWDDRGSAVGAHDVVIFAVRSTQPIVDDALPVVDSPAVWVDLGIPPTAIARPGVTYLGLSALHTAVAADPARAALGRAAVEAELGRVVTDMARRNVA
jgi:glutamyl-tRNA reductase